jgi:ribonuclease Z
MSGCGIKFIGTGPGKTSLKRYHSSFLISNNKYNLLVDAGDGISRALLIHKIPFSSINGILISHLHPDHYSGLASLIIQMKLTGRRKNLQIFIHKDLKKMLEDFFYYSYIFMEKMNFTISIEAFVYDKIVNINNSISFAGKLNSHLNKYKRYEDERKLSFSSSSFLFKINEKNIFYTADIGNKKDLFLFRDAKTDIIISEAAHIKVKDLLEAFQKLKPYKLFLTHIDEREDYNVLQKLKKHSSNKIVLAVDGYSFRI